MQNKVNQNIIGLNLDGINFQVQENQITWALNANIQSHDGDSTTYTNEPGNTSCYNFRDAGLDGFQVVGYTNVVEQSKLILFLAHPDGRSRIGQITAFNDSCLETVISESDDCGCINGKVVTGSNVQSTELKDIPTYACPEGYSFDPVTRQCLREVYTIPSKESVIYTCTTGFNSAWGDSGAALYDEGWQSNGVGTYALLPNWWKNGLNGRSHINNININTRLNGSFVVGQWIEFQQSLCIQSTKTYYIGISADNRFRIGLDGNYIIDPNTYDSNGDPIDTLNIPFVQNHLDANNGNHAFYGRFHIYPIEIPAGNHVISLEYYDFNNPQMIAAEIYDTDFNTILNAQSIDEIYGPNQENLIFTTDNKTFLEKIISQECPPGSVLQVNPETCTEGCFSVESVPQEVSGSVAAQCCRYEDIVVDDCLDFCPGSCIEYVIGYRTSGIQLESDGVVVAGGGPDLSTVEKYYSYTDCDGNEVNDFLLNENKRFRARKGTLKLQHDKLYIIQEVDVAETSQASFSKTNCCLNFDIAFPVQAEYRIDDCETKVYYISRNNPPRYFSVEYPYGRDACGTVRTCIKESCEDSKIFPDFCVPEVHTTNVTSGGQLAAGMYSFAVAYTDEQGIELTDYCDFNNPIPIFERAITEQTEYVTSKALEVEVFHKTRIFEYFNLVVAETINTTTTYHLVGTYRVNQATDKDQVIYTGDFKSTFSSIVPLIRSPHYETANIIEKQNDILMLADLEEYPKFNFQRFASRLELQWETVRMPADGMMDYSNPEIAYFFRTYQRDEVYAFGIKFKLKNGKYTDVFHIPGRKAATDDLIIESQFTNDDVIAEKTDCAVPDQLPRWKVYNTAVEGQTISLPIDDADEIEKQYNCAIYNDKRGVFAYWESTEVYPCYDEIWEQDTDPNSPYYNPDALGGKPIRHHKFPDSAITHIHDHEVSSGGQFDNKVGNNTNSNLYPIGVRVVEQTMVNLLNEKNPDGTYKYTVYDPIRKLDIPIKDVICGYELVRGNRVGNKSVVAKGLLYDVGTFIDKSSEYEGQKYYYSNYPYNDLNIDPYLKTNSAWYDDSRGPRRGVFGFKLDKTLLPSVEAIDLGSYSLDDLPFLDGFASIRNSNKASRFTFLSPDTSFQYPKIGTELKFETVEFGKVKGHFQQVEEHPQYRFLDKAAYYDSGILSAILSTEFKGETEVDVSLTGGLRNRSTGTIRYDKLLTNEQILLDIIQKLIPFVNFAWQYNSIATYNQYIKIDPLRNPAHKGNSRRFLELGYYANERVLQVFDDAPLHNRLRETSVYLKTQKPITHSETQIVDNSRYLASQHGKKPGADPTAVHEDRRTRAVYSSIKRQFPNQYGPIENMKYVSTGYKQDLITLQDGSVTLEYKYYPAFGGDTFITPFALKRKYAFFTRNLVNLPAKADEMPFDYWLFPNMGYPTYFIGTSNEVSDVSTTDILATVILIGLGYAGGAAASSLVGVAGTLVVLASNAAIMSGINIIWSKFVKKTCLDNNKLPRYYKDGMFYTASYGIPIYFVESDINTHFRFGRDTDKENFYPNAGGGIPDDWLQEKTVPIRFDNFYHYNATYSIQNQSPNFPYRLKYPSLECIVNHQSRVIYSDQATDSNLTSDKWLSYRPGNKFDFPKEGGRLIDLNAGETEKVYARFENTTKVYNARIVLTSTSPYQLEIGNADMFKQKPVDLSNTDLGYIGSQHKAYVRTEYGTFWVDAKRGHVYQITGQGFNEIKSAINYNWFKENLPFQILKDLPNADTDVPSLGIGIVMGWDERFERVFITKLDYRVVPAYRSGETYIDYITDRLDPDYRYFVKIDNGSKTRVSLTDTRYFENKSWTVAYSPKLKNFISFYSFLPNFFIPQLGHFQTIINRSAGASLWNHNLSPYVYQTYYGKLYPYIIEYVVNSIPINHSVTSVSLYAEIQEYYSRQDYYSLGTADKNNKNTANFTKAIVYNREQSSGIVNLIPEQFGNTRQKIQYPRMSPSGIQTLLSRRENKFTFNGFWNIAAQGNGQSLWTTNWADLQSQYPIDKLPNTKAVRNVGVAFQKNKIKSDFTRVRLIQDKYNRYKFVNNIQITQTNQSTI